MAKTIGFQLCFTFLQLATQDIAVKIPVQPKKLFPHGALL